MNERIKTLAEQATVTRGRMRVVDIEKYAELIIRECVQSIERTIETSCEFDSEKMGCEFAITDLKKHFGVE